MYFVSELLHRKGPQVATIPPTATALQAAQTMNNQRIGSLVVVEAGADEEAGEGGRVVGIITERDIMTRVVAAERIPHETPVAEIMTPRILTCVPETSLDEVRHLMRERRIRHLPVVSGGRLAGIVSIGDVNFAETQTLTETIGYLEAYISR